MFPEMFFSHKFIQSEVIVVLDSHFIPSFQKFQQIFMCM